MVTWRAYIFASETTFKQFIKAISVLVEQSLKMDWSPEVPKWCNSTTKRYLLKMDQACLTFHHMKIQAKQQLELWGQAEKCQEVQVFGMLLVIICHV